MCDILSSTGSISDCPLEKKTHSPQPQGSADHKLGNTGLLYKTRETKYIQRSTLDLVSLASQKQHNRSETGSVPTLKRQGVGSTNRAGSNTKSYSPSKCLSHGWKHPEIKKTKALFYARLFYTFFFYRTFTIYTTS